MRGAVDTLIASAPDGTLIVRQANLHQASIKFSFRWVRDREKQACVAYCPCGWEGKERAREATAIRDANRHEASEPARTIYPVIQEREVAA